MKWAGRQTSLGISRAGIENVVIIIDDIHWLALCSIVEDARPSGKKNKKKKILHDK